MIGGNILTNEVINNIYKRRSIRKYKHEQIKDEEIEIIIEAGRYAPSGGNNQTNHFLVIQSESVLSKLKQLVVQEFSKMEIEENTYKSLKYSIIQSKKGDYDFIFNAPTLVVVGNVKGYGNAMADAAVAIENMMLAATSLNIGSCWINQLKWLTNNTVIQNYLIELGLATNQCVCGGLSLGYSDSTILNALPRTGNKVTYIK